MFHLYFSAPTTQTSASSSPATPTTPQSLVSHCRCITVIPLHRSTSEGPEGCLWYGTGLPAIGWWSHPGPDSLPPWSFWDVSFSTFCLLRPLLLQRGVARLFAVQRICFPCMISLFAKKLPPSPLQDRGVRFVGCNETIMGATDFPGKSTRSIHPLLDQAGDEERWIVSIHISIPAWIYISWRTSTEVSDCWRRSFRTGIHLTMGLCLVGVVHCFFKRTIRKEIIILLSSKIVINSFQFIL